MGILALPISIRLHVYVDASVLLHRCLAHHACNLDTEFETENHMNDEIKSILYCDACGMKNPPTFEDSRCTTCCPQPNGLYDIGVEGQYGVGKTTSYDMLMGSARATAQEN